jgi:hypothetical protein
MDLRELGWEGVGWIQSLQIVLAVKTILYWPKNCLVHLKSTESVNFSVENCVCFLSISFLIYLMVHCQLHGLLSMKWQDDYE